MGLDTEFVRVPGSSETDMLSQRVRTKATLLRWPRPANAALYSSVP
jgi:hypothetical protein